MFMLFYYVSTQISKVLVHNCSEYSTCNECVEAGDPYCGWCSLQNKCTLKNNCPKGPKASELSLYWISYKSGQCTRITQVVPGQLQSSTARTVSKIHNNNDDLKKMFINGAEILIIFIFVLYVCS